MRTIKLLSTACLALFFAACASETTGSGGTGGKTSSSGTTSSSSGTTSSSSGTTSSSSSSSSSSSGSTSTTFLNGYGTNGTWKGYAFTAIAGTGTITPECDESGTATCFTTAGADICASGSVGPDTTYNSVGMVGWNIGQADIPPNPAELIATTGTGLNVNVAVTTGTELRIQLQAANTDATRWCAPLPTGGVGKIPWGSFNTKCWDGSGAAYTMGTPIQQIAVIAPSSDTAARAFSFCVKGFSAY